MCALLCEVNREGEIMLSAGSKSRRGNSPKQTNQREMGGIGGFGQRMGEGGGLGCFMPLASSTATPMWRLPHQGKKGMGKLGCRGCPAGDLSPQHPP